MIGLPLDAVLTSAMARDAGLSRWRLRRGDYRAVRWDVHVRADLDPSDPDIRIAVAAAAAPGGTVVGGWAAARLYEQTVPDRCLDLFDGWLPDVVGPPRRLPVLVTGEVSTRVSARSGMHVFRSVVPEDERAEVRGIPVTSPVRTAFDLARLWPLVPAVVALDRMLALRLVDVGELVEVVDRRRRWRGVPGARRALALADVGAESPRETVLRLLWQAAGFPRPLVNPVVLDQRGEFVARVDLLDPEAGVVGEYDGAAHADAIRRAGDARREEAIEDLGLVVVRAADPDVATPAGREAWRARLGRAYERARRRTTATWRVLPSSAAALPLEWSAVAARRLKWSDLAPRRST
ncbi:MAG: hypothetical protein GX609_09350 [Actinomycetales bacterium]|jgi:hypothetical protein|nr:hypothetical protein [Actinomycetales bacterium]